MKHTLLVGVFTLLGTSQAQSVLKSDSLKKEKIIWTKSSEFGMNAALSGTSPNWSGGVANNLSGNIFFNALAKADWGRINWDNNLKINIGAISTIIEDNNEEKYRSTKKNIDNVFFDSKFGYRFKAPNWLSAFASMNIQTQLLGGNSYLKSSIGRDSSIRTSSFMSQGVTMPSVGFEAKPKKWAFVRLGLGAVKQTWVLNQKLYFDDNPNIKYEDAVQTLYGVEKGKIIRNELGFNMQFGLDKSFGPKDIYNLKLNYLGFSPYGFSKSNSPLDSRFDFGFSAKIGKYVNLNYTLISIFDKDLSLVGQNPWQNSWILGIGFLYKL